VSEPYDELERAIEDGYPWVTVPGFVIELPGRGGGMKVEALLNALSQLAPGTPVRVEALEESEGISKRLEMEVEAGKLADALNDGLFAAGEKG